MKRKLCLFVCMIAFLAGFGALLHSPPSVADVLTGATSPKNESASTQRSDDYVLCMNTNTPALEDAQLREQIKQFIIGTSETIDTLSDSSLTIYADKSDRAVIRYAKTLCTRLQTAGIHIKLKQYSSTMLRSRAICGRYELILAADNSLDEDARKQADCLTLHSEEMAVDKS